MPQMLLEKFFLSPAVALFKRLQIAYRYLLARLYIPNSPDF